MMDFAARAAGCTIFSKIDLKSGYHQVPMNPADIPKMAITNPFGLWDDLRHAELGQHLPAPDEQGDGGPIL
jgi:hypothetical protein